MTTFPNRFAGAVLTVLAVTALISTPASSRSGGHAPKISGGVQAKAGAWPSQAALLVRTTPDNHRALFCGATVVASSWVLTSASCVQNRSAGKIDVLIGTQDLRSGGRRVRVTAIRFHPQWNRRTLDHDVALLKLARATAAKPQVLSSQPVATRTKVTVLGWGSLGDLHNTFPSALQQAEVETDSSQWCSFAWGPIFHPSTMLCTARYTTDNHARRVTSGDGGGPMLVFRHGVWAQVGVTSWGIKPVDGTSGSGGPVFAKVADATPWIRQTIKR